MNKFAAEIYEYETHVGTARKERLHAIGSGHGVRELTAGAETRKVPRRGSALSGLKTEEAFLLPQAPEALRGLARAGTGNRSAKVSFFHIRSRENKFFCSSPLFAWKGRDERSCFLKKSNLMKIIEEIEKSRLSEKEMNAITGGDIPISEQCREVEYRDCIKNYKTVECMIHLLTCDIYMYCGPKRYWNAPCYGYGECNDVKQQPLIQLT